MKENEATANAKAAGMNIFSLSNVEIHPDEVKSAVDLNRPITNPPVHMRRVVMHLAMANPLWRFIVTNTRMDGTATAFVVIERGEELGKIGLTYFRTGHKITISNDRVRDARERSSAYRTSDVAKAISMVKKMFYASKPSERVAKADEMAVRIMSQQANSKSRDARMASDDVRADMFNFIRNGGLPLFMEYVNGLDKHNRTAALNKLEKSENANMDMLTIEDIRKKFSAHDALLIVKDEGKYMVKRGEGVQIFDDNTLPEDVRSKLGMLKLVEAEHFVSSVGCRINDEIFVVLVKET